MSDPKKELLLSILSLDAYNQGYGRGIEHNQTQIGLAEVSAQDISEDAEDIGFHSVSYDTSYGTIISYRGTDAPDPRVEASDFWSGWTIGGGYIGEESQAREFQSQAKVPLQSSNLLALLYHSSCCNMPAGVEL